MDRAQPSSRPTYIDTAHDFRWRPDASGRVRPVDASPRTTPHAAPGHGIGDWVPTTTVDASAACGCGFGVGRAATGRHPANRPPPNSTGRSKPGAALGSGWASRCLSMGVAQRASPQHFRSFATKLHSQNVSKEHRPFLRARSWNRDCASSVPASAIHPRTAGKTTRCTVHLPSSSTDPHLVQLTLRVF